MIISTLHNLKISGIAAAVSNKWTSLKSIETGESEETIKKFTKMTGVEGRYEAEVNQTTSDFCFVAARELLKEKGVEASEIGALVFVTQTSDYIIPATSCVLHHRLGLEQDCIAFDVNLGCSGYTHGIGIIGSLMQNSNIEKALLLVGDTSAKERDPNITTQSSNSSKMLFGDSGTATLIEKSRDADPIVSSFRTDGSGYKAIISPYGGWRNPERRDIGEMDDIEVFNFTISEVPTMIKDFMIEQGTTASDYDYLVPHQANLFILKQMVKRAEFPKDKMLISIDKFGNTSSSSVPITLVKEFGDKKESKDMNLLMCGFGVGLSWSTVSATINSSDILPLIHTDEYFEDGYQENKK